MSSLENQEKKRRGRGLTAPHGLIFLLMVGLFGLASPGLPETPIKLRVTSEQANIREKPDITSVILLQVREGTLLEATSKEGEWYAVRVETEGGGVVVGYVHESLVLVVEPARVAEEKKEPVREVQEVEEKPQPRIPEKPKEIKEPSVPPSPPPGRPSRPPEERRPRVSLSLWWGGRFAQVGDLNEGAEGLARFYASALGMPSNGEIKNLHTGFVAGGEIQLPLSSAFFFSAGAEYFSSDASSTTTFGEKEPWPTYTTAPQVQVLPLSLSILVYPLRFFNLRVGLEYSLATARFLYRFESSGVWKQWEGKADSSALGYLAGVGIDWALSRHIGLVAEALYRHSILTPFEGEGSYEDSAGDKVKFKGKLYFFQAATTADETVPLLFLREKEPVEPGVSDVSEADLDLRGLTLRAGLRIRF